MYVDSKNRNNKSKYMLKCWRRDVIIYGGNVKDLVLRIKKKKRKKRQVKEGVGCRKSISTQTINNKQ